MSYFHNTILSNAINYSNSFFDTCIINIDAVFTNCKFEKCIFTSMITSFKNCTFKNNVYPDECNWKEITLDAYKNRLPEGDLIVYKKVYSDINCAELVAKLLIPAKAKRVNGSSSKCRAEYAKVLGFYRLSGNRSRVKVCRSSYNYRFKYRVGDIVKPITKFDTSVKVCSTGIHFLLTFDEAKNYY